VARFVEHGDTGWAGGIGHVGVPDASSVGMANVAAIFLDVGHEHDLWMLRMGIMRQEDALDLAKAAGKVDELLCRDTLLPQAEQEA